MEARFFLSQYLYVVVGLPIVAAVASSVVLLRSFPASPITPLRMLLGYLGAVLVALGMITFLLYTPSDAAEQHFQVLPEYHTQAYLGAFVVMALVCLFLLLMGIALVGAPVVFVMVRRGRGSIAHLLMASLPASALFVLLRLKPPIDASMMDLVEVAVVPLLLMLGLTTGLGLPLLHALPETDEHRLARQRWMSE